MVALNISKVQGPVSIISMGFGKHGGFLKASESPMPMNISLPIWTYFLSAPDLLHQEIKLGSEMSA